MVVVVVVEVVVVESAFGGLKEKGLSCVCVRVCVCVS